MSVVRILLWCGVALFSEKIKFFVREKGAMMSRESQLMRKKRGNLLGV